jgi:hypothetical protein
MMQEWADYLDALKAADKAPRAALKTAHWATNRVR